MTNRQTLCWLLASGLFLVLLSGCGQAGVEDAPNSMALSDDSPLASLEIRTSEVQVLEPPTTVVPVIPTTSTSTSTTTTPLPSSTVLPETVPPGVCNKGSDFPVFEGAVSVTKADVDLDGEDDEVFLLAEPLGLAHDAWIAVTFADGGMATGRWEGFFEVAPVVSLSVVELTNGSGINPEIVFGVATGPTITEMAVMTLEDCSVVTTTIDGAPFTFEFGTSIDYSASSGCAYGTGGRIEFTSTAVNGATGSWITDVYILDGHEWSLMETFGRHRFPALEMPTSLSLADCTGV